MAAALDPHVAWKQQEESLRRLIDDDGRPDDDTTAEALAGARWALHDQIINTPARSPAGVLAQLRLALEYIEIENGRGILRALEERSDSELALLNAIATLEHMAAEG